MSNLHLKCELNKYKYKHTSPTARAASTVAAITGAATTRATTTRAAITAEKTTTIKIPLSTKCFVVLINIIIIWVKCKTCKIILNNHN